MRHYQELPNNVHSPYAPAPQDQVNSHKHLMDEEGQIDFFTCYDLATCQQWQMLPGQCDVPGPGMLVEGLEIFQLAK